MLLLLLHPDDISMSKNVICWCMFVPADEDVSDQNVCTFFSLAPCTRVEKWRYTRRKNQFYQQHQHTYTLISSAKRSLLDNKIKQWMETPFKNGTNQATHKNMNNFWQTDNQLVEIFLLQFVLNIVRDYLWSERHIQLFFSFRFDYRLFVMRHQSMVPESVL